MPTLVNVCGTSHSGTTMVDLMLGNSDNAFSCGEACALFRPWRTHHFRISCSCPAGSSCPIWNFVKGCRESGFHGKLFAELQVDFVIDSSKSLSWVIDNNSWASANGISFANLLVWKDPLYLAYSHWKRGDGISTARNRFVTYYERFLKMGIPFVALSYNELIRDPGNKLKDLCESIGMQYFEGKERFWEKEHHHLFGSRWTRRQVEMRRSTIRAFEEFPKDFLAEWGALGVGNDRNIQRIMAILQDSDVSKKGKTGARGQSEMCRKVRPVWYYRHKLWRIYKRRFPDPWPYEQ